LRTYYLAVLQAWGRQHWWPARTRFEVIVGAYLTQNTAWTNVERALRRLRLARVLTLEGVRRTSLEKLETLIRSAGYFRQKAERLKTFVRYVDKAYAGSLDRMFTQPTEQLRQELLALNGVGPETADSILLYAGNHPVFVVDAYTRRILARHNIYREKARYEEIRKLFERALAPLASESLRETLKTRKGKLGTVPGAAHPPSPMSTAQRSPLVQVYNEMHGLIVGIGKNHCFRSEPNCEQCPLRPFLP